MATLVFFHAHPDDESLNTGGVMARAAEEGHRVVLVVATGGEQGEAPPDLAPGETVADRRRTETECSAAVLGVGRVAWLGYRDSGMTGWPQNDAPDSFVRAKVDEAAARLAAILTQEAADVVTVYDDHGNYFHPDHIQVHHVGHRAARMAGTPVVYEATMNRDQLRRLMAYAAEQGIFDDDEDAHGNMPDTDTWGTPEHELTTAVDVTRWIERKRASIACHASQRTDTEFFLSMTPETFRMAFGVEYFRRLGAPAGIHEHDLAGLDA